MRDTAINTFTEMQERLVQALSALDPAASIQRDKWRRDDAKVEDGGGGCSIVLSGGGVFEKAGVNFSAIQGVLTPEMSRALLSKDGEIAFTATGTSVVIHPRSPMVPTVHANVRYFETASSSWFGGGTDLTPYYLFEEDARSFHSGLQEICARHDPGHYPRFKRWCDEYFYLPHRGETRGVGGIFFDYLGREEKGSAPQFWPFVRDLATGFQELYLPIVKRRQELPYGEREKHFQLLRRGRYVEFNLIYDRGTAFGLKSGGRTESILMSLPAEVRWEYCYEPESGSREAELLEILRHPQSWVAS